MQGEPRASLEEHERLAWKAFFVAYALVMEQVERRLNEAGIGSMAEYDALYTLSQSPEGALDGRELLASVTLSQSGFSRLITRLEGRGLVTRTAAKGDRRAIRIALTAEGERTLDAIWNEYAAAVAQHFARHLNQRDALALVRALRKVIGPLATAREAALGAPFLHRV